MLDMELGLGVDTGGLDFVPGRASQPAIEVRWKRATGTGVFASHIVEEGRQP